MSGVAGNNGLPQKEDKGPREPSRPTKPKFRKFKEPTTVRAEDYPGKGRKEKKHDSYNNEILALAGASQGASLNSTTSIPPSSNRKPVSSTPDGKTKAKNPPPGEGAVNKPKFRQFREPPTVAPEAFKKELLAKDKADPYLQELLALSQGNNMHAGKKQGSAAVATATGMSSSSVGTSMSRYQTTDAKKPSSSQETPSKTKFGRFREPPTVPADTFKKEAKMKDKEDPYQRELLALSQGAGRGREQSGSSIRDHDPNQQELSALSQGNNRHASNKHGSVTAVTTATGMSSSSVGASKSRYQTADAKKPSSSQETPSKTKFGRFREPPTVPAGTFKKEAKMKDKEDPYQRELLALSQGAGRGREQSSSSINSQSSGERITDLQLSKQQQKNTSNLRTGLKQPPHFSASAPTLSGTKGDSSSVGNKYHVAADPGPSVAPRPKLGHRNHSHQSTSLHSLTPIREERKAKVGPRTSSIAYAQQMMTSSNSIAKHRSGGGSVSSRSSALYTLEPDEEPSSTCSPFSYGIGIDDSTIESKSQAEDAAPFRAPLGRHPLEQGQKSSLRVTGSRNAKVITAEVTASSPNAAVLAQELDAEDPEIIVYVADQGINERTKESIRQDALRTTREDFQCELQNDVEVKRVSVLCDTEKQYVWIGLFLIVFIAVAAGVAVLMVVLV